MSATQGKSKRDLIWEEKKRAREQLLQNGISSFLFLILA